MASPHHPFYFAELLLAEELEDFVDHAHAEVHLPAQLGQSHFTIEVQRFQCEILKNSSADASFLDFVGRNPR
jgi:hypothetical protein